MPKHQEKIKNGFTLIELLVAMAIFSVVILTAVSIFTVGMGGTKKIFGQQAVQESGRFILESISKEIRMSEVNGLNGTLLASLPDGLSGPYASLRIINADKQTIDYIFNEADKQVSRAGSVLNPNDINASGKFYLLKNGNLQPRITVILGLASKTEEKYRAAINLQTTASSREYAQ
ncbi:MAG: prepilin-type N-terminal cleavage/methylation domain-containing protein [Candidatus Portnoybacteria bacterium]|nr:prepilin-type N-terminal cleavage/methylation domain-containing protein [Candidatus Portnoybacteria bacterium]MDD4982903.1 prepilin-type N-terminal cleavage/methylation domain-containing protein [Candidatus Portnoybacteria bacterium]